MSTIIFQFFHCYTDKLTTNIRNIIFRYTGNFLLNLFKFKCYYKKHNEQWNEQRNIIIRKLNEYIFRNIQINGNKWIAESFKSIINSSDIKYENVYITLDLNKLKKEQIRELLYGFNKFVQSQQINETLFCVFAHYITSEWIHESGIKGYTLFHGQHAIWECKSNIKKIMHRCRTELILKQMIPLLLKDTMFVWYLTIQVRSNGYFYADINVVAEGNYEILQKYYIEKV
eukprot:63335_1